MELSPKLGRCFRTTSIKHEGQVHFLVLRYKNSLKSRLASDMAYLGGQFPCCASCGCRWICVSTACLQALTFGHNETAVIVGFKKIPRIKKVTKTNKQTKSHTTLHTQSPKFPPKKHCLTKSQRFQL